MKRFGKIISVLLLASMTASLFACGGGGDASQSGGSGNQTQRERASAEDLLVYTESPLTLETKLPLSSVSGMFACGEDIILWGRPSPYDNIADPLFSPEDAKDETGTDDETDRTDADDDTDETGTESTADETSYPLLIERFTPGDTKSETVHFLPDISDGNFEDLSVDDAGNFYTIFHTWPVWYEEGEESPEAFRLIAFDAAGQTLWEVLLEEPEQTSEYVWREYHLTCTRTGTDDRLIVSGTDGVTLYDPETGEAEQTIVTPSGGDYYSALYASTLRDGRAVLFGYNGDMVAYVYNNATKEAEDLPAFPDDTSWYRMHTGLAHDFYFENNSAIYAFDIGDTASQKIVSFSDSDLSYETLNSFIGMEDQVLILYDAGAEYYMGRSFGYSSASDGSSMTLAMLTKADPSEYADREIITIGTTSITSAITNQVIRFNKQNAHYKIRIIDYSSYNSADSWTGAWEQIGNDIITGNAPDMIALDNQMPVDSYFAKGVFLPLDDYFANDEEISKASYIDNVFDAYRHNGSLYVVIPSFTAIGVAMRKDLADTLASWTLEDAADLMKKEGVNWENLLGFNIPRSYVVQILTSYAGKQFINREEGRANFDSEGFRQLLTFAAHFPTEEEWQSSMNDYDWEQTETAYRDGRALLNITDFRNFDDYMNLRYGTFGTEISFVGYPLGEFGIGNTIDAEEQIAISAQSPYADVCWEFLREYLLPEYQQNIPYSFPVLRSAFDEQAEKARTPETYLDENGKEQIITGHTYIGNIEVEIPTATVEDTDFLLAFFESITAISQTDEQVLSIIEEEAEPFFRGQKSVEEVSAIIQNRIQVYLDETS